MSRPADYHMHTPLCRHASGEPSAYAAHAVKLGLAEIGFSDHAPMPEDDFDDWRMRQDQLELYVAKVEQARREFPQLRIKLALEMDYLPEYVDWARALAKRYPWDYLIGSVHYVSGHWDVDNPFRRDEWKKRDIFQVWQEYYQRLAEAVASGLFDIIGHCDLPKKFGYRPLQDSSPLVEPVLAAAAATDTAIELNTAGLRKECREIYPELRVLQRARQLGVAITFGSDAHAPEEVGADFAAAIALAKQAGYAEWRSFDQRRKISHPL